MTPTEKILEQIMWAQKRHGHMALSGMGREVPLDSSLAVDEGCRCGAGWPCDAVRTLRQLEEAVKALTELKAGTLRPAHFVAEEAISRIAALAEGK